MASSGALGTSNQFVKYRIDVTPGKGNVEGNYTPVTVNVVAYRTNTGFTTYGTGTIWCKINGTQYSAGIDSSQKITNAGITLFSKTVNVYHEADGTKLLTVSASLSIPGANLSSSDQSFSFYLEEIGRASTISSVEGDMIGSQIVVNINRASTDFIHQVWYRIGKSEWFDMKIGYFDMCVINIELDKCQYITDATSATLDLCVRTFSGSNRVGSDYYDYSHKIKVPETVVPTIQSLSISETVSGVAEKFAEFIQNVSKLKIKTTAEGVYGSTISSVTVDVAGNSYSGSEIVTNAITTSGNVNVSVKVKDSRGRIAETVRSIEVVPYAAPNIMMFEVMRSDDGGTEDLEGEYANCDVVFNISPILNKNDKSYKIEYKQEYDTEWQTIKSGSVYSYDGEILSGTPILDSDLAYVVRLTVSDYFTEAEAEFDIGTGTPLMDFRYTGKGMAIGKVSERDAFEVNMEAEFYQEIFINNGHGDRINLLDFFPVPVGSIFVTEVQFETDPSEYYPWSTWERIKGRTIVGVDENDNDFEYAGKTGGEKNHKLTKEEIAAHEHNVVRNTNDQGLRFLNSYQTNVGYGTGWWMPADGSGGSQDRKYIAESTGGDKPHNNMQPYYAMYMWKRIS